MEQKFEKKRESQDKLEKYNDESFNITKIIENIIELDSEEVKPKRNNSFNCSYIFQYKNKIKKNNTKAKKKEFNLTTPLENNIDKNKRSNSASLKSGKKSDKINNEKISFKSDLSSSKNQKSRNFILKSEILVLNKKNKSDFKTYSGENIKKNNLDLLFTKRNKEQVKFNDYNFFIYMNDNNINNNDNNTNINKSNIISNIYMDIEENNEELEYQIRKMNENKLNNGNILSNYFSSNVNHLINDYYNNKDNFNEIHLNNNHNEISINIMNNQKRNNNSNYSTIDNNIKKEENKIYSNQITFSNIHNKYDKNDNFQNNINNSMQQNNFINNNYNENNSKKMPQNIIFNNYINNTYIFPNQPNYYPHYNNNQFYYQNSQFSQYYQNNCDLFSYNKNYYKTKNNKSNQYLDMFPQTNQNKMNIIVNNDINYKDDKSLAQNAVNLSKTQVGSKILQEKILSDENFTNVLLFPKIKNNLKEICCDIFGNCLIKAMLEKLNDNNIEIFINLIKDPFYDICLSEPGSRSIQILMEIICDKPVLLNQFIFCLNNKNIGILFKANYGNHILQKYLSLVKNKEHTYFIYNYIFNNFLDIIKDKHGVCVIQKSLAEAEDDIRIKLLEFITLNLEIIIKDNYANFILQYVFTKFNKRKFNEIFPIILKIEENIVDYCKCKNSSSVIEKCFEKGDQQISEHIIKHLFEKNSDYLREIIYNPHGFYIVKKSMMVKNQNTKLIIIKAIIDNINEIKGINNGKKIIENFSNNYKEFNYLLNLKANGNVE